MDRQTIGRVTGVIEGSLDERLRPLVRLKSQDESFLAVVDTGFNRQLLMPRPLATSLRFRDTGTESSMAFAVIGADVVQNWYGQIWWFGTSREVLVHVTNDTTDLKLNGDYLAYMGAELLNGCHLFVDYVHGRVTIEQMPSRIV